MILYSCSETDKSLQNAESKLMDNPQEAYVILSEMDTLSMSETQKARRALLLAYTAAINSAPVDMAPMDLERAVCAFDGKCTSDEVKSLIIKSLFAKADNNPVMRLEILKDAEFLALQLGDRLDLAFVYLNLSNVYSDGFNGVVSEHYANKALSLFNEGGYRKHSIDARMAIVGALVVKRDYTAALDSLLSMKSNVMAYSTDSYKRYFLDTLARTLDENGRSDEAIELWHSIIDINNASANTLAHLARAYIHNGRLDSAEIIINKAIAVPHNNADEFLCRNVQYDIAERLGRKSELPLIDSLRNRAANIDYDRRKIAESSLALNKKYDSATQSAWNEIQKNKQQRIILISVFAVFSLLMLGGILFYRKKNQLLRIEHENNLLRLRNIENNLFAEERQRSETAEKVSMLFKSRFNTIDRLATAYFECRATGQEQKRLFAETKSAIDAFCSDSSIHELEEIVNTANDNLMSRFDEDYPRLSVSQRKLALYIFCGLSLQSISIFQGADLRNIYVYKSRLKATISKSSSSRKDLYLSYFN